MGIETVDIYETLFTILALLLLIYDMLKRERVVQETKLAGALALGIFVAYAQGANMLLFLPGILIFYFLGRFYGRIDDVPVALLAAAYVLVASSYVNTSLVAEAALFGLLASVDLEAHTHSNRENKERETSRDLLQIGFGIIMLLVFYFLPLHNAEVIALIFLIIGYLTADYVMMYGKTRLARFLSKMERKDTILGEGAIMLGIGTLIAISALNSLGSLFVVFAALYVGDSAATIVGVNFGTAKLFYNKNKSLLGSMAYFVVVSLFGYPFFGPIALFFGFVAALAESMPTTIDDNFFVAIILVFLMLILG